MLHCSDLQGVGSILFFEKSLWHDGVHSKIKMFNAIKITAPQILDLRQNLHLQIVFILD